MSVANAKVKVERKGSWGKVVLFAQPDDESSPSLTSSDEDYLPPTVLAGSFLSPLDAENLATDSPTKESSSSDREKSLVTEYTEELTARRDQECRNLKRGRITLLESRALACVLDDALTQVVILANCNHDIRSMKLDIISVERKRFNIKSDHSINLARESMTDEASALCSRVSKWDDDRQMVASILARMFVDMAYNRSFQEMEDQLEKWKLEDERDQILMEEETILKAKLSNLVTKLQHEVESNEVALKERDGEYRIIIDAVDDSELMNQVTLRYTARREKARSCQLALIQKTEEQQFENDIKNFKKKTDQEMRITADIENYIQLGIDNYQEQIEEWMKMYDEETEDLDMTIRATRDETFNLEQECEQLQQKLDKWTTETEAWTNFTEERRRNQTYLNKMNTCATMVQSWWRGMLVRRQLGPYAPKKGKKEKGKRKGKGKKK